VLFSPVIDSSLDPILRQVSRTIYLTLRVAPRATRRQLGIAYLFCRAADTIADTRLAPQEARRGALDRFRAQFERAEPSAEEIASLEREVGPPQAIPEERELLLRLGECFAAYAALAAADRARLRALVATLTRGMEMDLERFPAEESGLVGALGTDDDLDLYTYYVAGCVGEFWTDLHAAHLPALGRWDLARMREKAVRFGKGLQMTNILRDVEADLAIGRCYFPRARLETQGVTPEDLRAGRRRDRLRPLFEQYLERVLADYRAGWEYTLAIPRSLPRLRLACVWPLLLGLRTLALLAKSPDPYAPGAHHKISRAEVYSILRRSAGRVFSDRGLDRMYRALEKEVA
jgi:farnesyl-diphosphate farnesyltransferase